MKRNKKQIQLIILLLFTGTAHADITKVVDILKCRDVKTITSNITEDVYLRKCHDDTYTIYTQPGARSKYNGVCGPTVATALMTSYCGKAFNPYDAQELGYFSDITPGTRPGTMKSSLNDLFRENSRHCPRGRWKLYGATNGYQFLNLSLNRMKRGRSKSEKDPFVVFVRSKNKDLHYFPLVNIYFVQNRAARVRTLTSKPGLSGSDRSRNRSEWLRNRQLIRRAQRPSESKLANQPTRVTSGNISQCRVAVNDYSVQKIYTCANLLSMMRAANDIYGLSAIYKDYTYIVFE